MCGIWGCSRLTEITRAMMPMMAFDMEGRGRDSWGATDGTHDVRALGPVTSSWYGRELQEGQYPSWSRGIFHTRAASVGAVTLPNCHPFTSIRVRPDATGGAPEDLDKIVVGIHNGCIGNHLDLNKSYPDRAFEVDSMHIFEHIAKDLPVREIQGWGAIAWYEFTPKDPTGTLFLARFNADNLNVAILGTGELVFCSTPDPITRAAWMARTYVRMWYKVDGDQKYEVQIGGGKDGSDQLLTSDRMVFGGRATVVTYSATDWDQWKNRGHGGDHSPNEYTGGTRGVVGDGRPTSRGTGVYSPNSHHANIHTVGSEGRASNECVIGSCTNKVDPDRGAALVCEVHFQIAVEQCRGNLRTTLVADRGESLKVLRAVTQ